MTQIRKIIANGIIAIFLISHQIFPVIAQSDKTDIKIGDSTLTLYADLEKFEIGSQAIIDWVEKSANIVADYYGQFPVNDASVVLDGFNGGGVISGRAHGEPVLQVIVEIGEYVTQKHLNRDWILVHELIHLALADVADKHHWLEEGLPTYIESVSRVQAGDLEPEFVWKGFLKNMPKGLTNGKGLDLDNASSLGQVYWGGALFSLLADVEIHQQTDNKFGLRDSLQAIVKSGLTMDKSTTLSDLFEIADNHTGTEVLSKLYADMKNNPVEVNLNALWSALGINYNNDSGLVSFDDTAPLAAIRNSIMLP